MMKQILRTALSIILLVSFSVEAEIFKWVDEETGAVVYSDQPGKNSKPVKLHGVSQYNSRQVPTRLVPKPEKKAPVYKSVSIISPAHNSTIRDNTGNVPVSLGLSPALKKGHKVILDIDGQELALDSNRFIIKNVSRGSHKLSARVVDKNGKVLIKSKVSQFHLKRHSVLFKRK